MATPRENLKKILANNPNIVCGNYAKQCRDEVDSKSGPFYAVHEGHPTAVALICKAAEHMTVEQAALGIPINCQPKENFCTVSKHKWLITKLEQYERNNAELKQALENQKHECKHEMSPVLYIAKPNQPDRILITKNTKINEKTTEGSELNKCHYIILGFHPLSNEEEVQDTIDISDFGLKSKQDFSFETISGSGATSISAIKISGQDGYVACVYNFDATNFESPSYMAKDFVLIEKV